MIYLSVCPTTAFTREVILGTTNGQLYETAIEEKDKKEKYVKLLFEITEAPEPFIGVQMETVTTGTAVRYFVMAATPSRLYIFQGTTSLEVNSCLPLGILCAHSLLCLTPCLLSPSWAGDFTARGPWSAYLTTRFLFFL
jgi:hypothetical protein